MRKKDPYQDFASVYDQWQALYPQPFSLALAPRIRALVRAAGSPRKVLADLACGTGTFALWWKKQYPAWTVIGADRSAAMIRAARAEAAKQRRAGTEGVRRGAAGMSRSARGRSPAASDSLRPAGSPPRFLVQSLTELSLPEPAGIVTCLFDSLNHVTDRRELRRIFERVHSALAPRGLFLFDLVDELAFPEVFTGTSILDGRDLYVGMETEYSEEGAIGTGRATFTFFRRRGTAWRRIRFCVRERRWFRGEIRDLLHEARLDLLKLEKIDPYESRQFFVPRTFWLCQRSR